MFFYKKDISLDVSKELFIVISNYGGSRGKYNTRLIIECFIYHLKFIINDFLYEEYPDINIYYDYLSKLKIDNQELTDYDEITEICNYIIYDSIVDNITVNIINKILDIVRYNNLIFIKMELLNYLLTFNNGYNLILYVSIYED